MALPPRPMGSLVDTGAMQGGPDDMLPSVDIPLDTPEDFSGGAEVIQNADGTAMVQALADMIEQAEAEAPMEHDVNLAEFLDDGYMGELSSELRSSYQEDQDSRSDWEEAYTKGLDQLGIRQQERTEPFQGASGVTHPLIAESVTQFQAQAYKELLPAGGPVQTQVMGKQDSEREAQAHRVKAYMNYQIMEVMDEYDPDMDQLLFYLP